MNDEKQQGMWAYLEASGVLENGTDEEIKKVKRDYRKIYIREYKRNQRKEKPEFIISFSKGNGEYSRVKHNAQKHKMSITKFIRQSSLAYIDKTFIVPDREQVARLEQFLSHSLNEIKTLVSRKEKFLWDANSRYDAIEKRIQKMEATINETLRHPSDLEDEITKAINNNPALNAKLLTLLSSKNDSQNIHAQETGLQKTA